MKLMIIKYQSSYDYIARFFQKLLKFGYYNDINSIIAKEILAKEDPVFIYMNLDEPVNGDNDVVTMLSSIGVNTRLRVFIINVESLKDYLKETIKNFILPGRDQHKLDTP